MYEIWNKEDPKNVQVVLIHGDDTRRDYMKSIEFSPWVAIPWNDEGQYNWEAIIYNGLPSYGALNGTTGEVIQASIHGGESLNQGIYLRWLAIYEEQMTRFRQNGEKIEIIPEPQNEEKRKKRAADSIIKEEKMKKDREMIRKGTFGFLQQQYGNDPYGFQPPGFHDTSS